MISDLTQERLAALEAWIRSQSRGRWLVLPHDNPDPDALVSATLIAHVLRHRFKQRVTVAYGGIIGRAENRALVNYLHLKLSHRRYLKFKNYQHFALVDSQAGTGNNQLPEGTLPDLVIDHHPARRQTLAVPHFDIRPQYGATASIVAEYALASGLDFTRREATGIVYAIRSETLDFSRESPGPDRQLHDYFLGLADKRLLGKIQNPRLPLAYFHNLHQALDNITAVGKLIVSHAGKVSQPDIVPELADLLLRLEGKTWSMVTGVYEDRVYVSLRTTNPRADCEKLMHRLLARRGRGGGHGMLAGGWLPAPNAEAAVLAQNALAQKLVRLLRMNPAKLAPVPMSSGPASELAPASRGENVVPVGP